MRNKPCFFQTPSLLSNNPWTANELLDTKSEWTYHLNAAQVIEIEQALAHLRSTGKTFLQCTPLDFPLPTLRKTLQRAVLVCEIRTGIFLIRGLPIEQLSEEDARLLAWGIGLHLGVPLIQNRAAQLLVDVRDGHAHSDRLRGHTTNEAMEFHVDSCDLATLLCRRSAMQGGQSRIANMVTIHNQMGRENIEWQKALYEPLPFFALSDKPEQIERYFLCPVFSCEHSIFAARFYQKRILACRDLPEAPALSRSAVEGCEAFLRIANDPENCLEFHLRPGDLQLLNNHVVCHARRNFVDDVIADRKRHLFRQWFATPFSRLLPESFREAYGRVEPATLRGGYKAWSPPLDVCSFQKTMAAFNNVIV